MPKPSIAETAPSAITAALFSLPVCGRLLLLAALLFCAFLYSARVIVTAAGVATALASTVLLATVLFLSDDGVCAPLSSFFSLLPVLLLSSLGFTVS